MQQSSPNSKLHLLPPEQKQSFTENQQLIEDSSCKISEKNEKIDFPFSSGSLVPPKNMTIIGDPFSWPYSCIGMVLVQYQDGQMVHRAGTLVDKNLVLTYRRVFESKDILNVSFIAQFYKGKGKTIKVAQFPSRKSEQKSTLLSKDTDICFLKLSHFEDTLQKCSYPKIKLNHSDKQQTLIGIGYCRVEYFLKKIDLIRVQSESNSITGLIMNQASEGAPIFSNHDMSTITGIYRHKKLTQEEHKQYI